MASDTCRAVGPAPAGAPHLLFLSHAGIDSEAALRLARRLEACEEAQTHGLKVWIDKVDLDAGGRWKDALQTALVRSTAFAVYVGSHGVVNWVWDEVSVALDRTHKERDYPLVPVLARGTTSADLPSFLSQYQAVGDPEEPDELRKLLHAVLRLEPRAKLALERDPFVGLQPYDSTRRVFSSAARRRPLSCWRFFVRRLWCWSRATAGRASPRSCWRAWCPPSAAAASADRARRDRTRQSGT
jgi:TIR domain